jgi:hypothetical protein
MSRILDYLVEAHGKRTLARWPGPTGVSESPETFLRVRDVDYLDRYSGDFDMLHFGARSDAPVDVAGYDLLIPFTLYEHDTYPMPRARFQIRLAKSTTGLDILEGSTLRATLPLDPVLGQLEKEPSNFKEEAEPLVVSAEQGGLRLKAILTSLHAERRGESWAIQSADGDMLVGE